jgi:glycosyltransferase involved in cell wall biosynthesis
MPAPNVSVIVNNFNYAQFVGVAVGSALSQTYSNCEVIVVDDGSTDKSREVLKQFEGRAQVLLKENEGQVSAFNLGFLHAKGDLIIFLDSDDALFPEAIESAVAAWRPNVVKVQFPLEILDPKGRRTGLLMPRCQLSEGDLLDEFLETGRYVTSPTSGNVYSRPFLERLFPLPPAEWDHGDAYLNTCAPFYGTISAIHRPLGLYRIHGKSMSSVTHNGLDVGQMEKLMRHAMSEKTLLETLSRDHGFTLSKRAVVSHWMHLKLKISLDKLSSPRDEATLKALLGSAYAMFVSVAKSDDLSLLRKLQHTLWAFAVALLPSGQAIKVIRYAFDQAPQSRFSRFLRRV